MDRLSPIISGVSVAAIVAAATWVVNTGVRRPSHELTVRRLVDRMVIPDPRETKVSGDQSLGLTIYEVENTGRNRVVDQDVWVRPLRSPLSREPLSLEYRETYKSDDFDLDDPRVSPLRDAMGGYNFHFTRIQPHDRYVFAILHRADEPTEIAGRKQSANVLRLDVGERTPESIQSTILTHWIFGLPVIGLMIGTVLVFNLGRELERSRAKAKAAK